LAKPKRLHKPLLEIFLHALRKSLRERKYFFYFIKTQGRFFALFSVTAQVRNRI
jgi:hypothetical protein